MMTKHELIEQWRDGQLTTAEVYGATFSSDWARGLAAYVPDHMQSGVVRYLVFGILPGDFLQAVLCNSLFEAFQNADDINRSRMHNYVIFFNNFAPSNSFGTHDIMTHYAKEIQSEFEREAP